MAFLVVFVSVRRGANFSRDRIYRYTLWDVWAPEKGLVQFIGLNPSTADEEVDDPTVHRCKRFADRWGFGGLVMTNAYALRATDPKNMKAHQSPVGEENDDYLRRVSRKANLVVAAWGAGIAPDREGRIKKLLAGKLHILGLTKGGNPRHPLYLKSDLLPQEWC